MKNLEAVRWGILGCGDVCEVKDDHVISNNFPKRIEKGVKVISTFRRNLADSTWYLEGDWKTTKTKKYYAVSGKVDLKEEKDYTKSKLYPHLEELGLEKENRKGKGRT